MTATTWTGSSCLHFSKNLSEKFKKLLLFSITKTTFMFMVENFRWWGQGTKLPRSIQPIHNIHLIIFVELGLIGFLGWVYYIISRIRRFLKTPLGNMNSPIVWYSFLGMLIIASVHGMAEWVYLHAQYQFIFMMFGTMYSSKHSL